MMPLNYPCGCRFMAARVEVTDVYDGGTFSRVVVAHNPELCPDHAEVVQ